MTRPTWDETWLNVAKLMARRSNCCRGAGCVIVDQQQRVVATGYSGPPAAWRRDARDYLDESRTPYDDCRNYCVRARTLPEHRHPGYADCPSSHAEMNALMFSDRSRVEGGTLYVSSTVCGVCMKAVGNSGVVRVVWATDDVDYEYRGDSRTYLEACGITVDIAL